MPAESVIEKIKKLLALADGNQNEHEREVAMQFAMELLAKHNLTMTEIAGQVGAITTQEVEGDFRLEPWIRFVLNTACTLYYTDFYISCRYDMWGRSYKDVPVFVGSSENIAVTIEMATWLLNSIRKESNRAYKSAPDRRSFRYGAAGRLLTRARNMVKNEGNTAAETTGTSLMVVRNQLKQAVQEHMDQLNLNPVRQRQVYVVRDAYANGQQYGSQLSLNKAEQQNARVVNAPQLERVR